MMPPKRKRGRPRRETTQQFNSRNLLVFEKHNDITENISKEVMEYICSICDKSFKNKLRLDWHLKACSENNSKSSGTREVDSNSEGQLHISDDLKSDLEEEDDQLSNSGDHGMSTEEMLAMLKKKKARSTLQLPCTKCSKVFVFKKSFEKHIKNEHAEGPNSVICDYCNISCPDKEILQKHIEKKHSIGQYECEYCHQTFVRKAHVTRHMLQKGCDGSNYSVYSCGICDSRFSRKDNLMVHLRLQHIAKKQFACKQCEFVTRNFSKLIIHAQKLHYPKPLQFECDHCGKITSSRASITKHLEIHGEKKYACAVCGYQTFTIEVMRRHTLTHVADKPHKCSICPSSYIQRAQLVKHLEKHTLYRCPHCTLHFQNREELIIHEKLHDGDLSCSFEDCDQVFRDQLELQKHMRSHLRMYKCAVCGNRFKSEMNMRRHVSTHALERPRRCMYCLNARAYVRGEQLLRHVRKCHRDIFRQRLLHVRRVLGSETTTDRVTKSEMEAVLTALDAESDRIIGDFGNGVLYGGLQDTNDLDVEYEPPEKVKKEPNALLSEEELTEKLKELLSKLIEQELLEAFGWPDAAIDEILEKVIENCGARAADRRWSRVQRLRENTKHLFLYVVEERNVADMLSTHTIDQVVLHILDHVDDDN